MEYGSAIAEHAEISIHTSDTSRRWQNSSRSAIGLIFQNQNFTIGYKLDEPIPVKFSKVGIAVPRRELSASAQYNITLSKDEQANIFNFTS